MRQWDRENKETRRGDENWTATIVLGVSLSQDSSESLATGEYFHQDKNQAADVVDMQTKQIYANNPKSQEQRLKTFKKVEDSVR